MDEQQPSPGAFLTAEHRLRWQCVQESFARITKMSLWTINPQGKIIGTPSNPSELCLLLRKNDKSRSVCNEDCIKNCQRAIRSGSTVFFRCHTDLLCFAAPLRSLGMTIGVLLGGQILTGPPPLEKYSTLARQCGLDEDKVKAAVGRMTIGADRSLRLATDFITDTAEIIFSSWANHGTVSRRLSLLSNLLSLAAELSPNLDIHELHALVLNSLAVLFDLSAAAIFTADGPDGPLAARYAFGPCHAELMKLSLRRDDPLLAALTAKGDPTATDDYYHLLKSGFPEVIRQAAFFPLFSGEELSGVVAVLNRPLDESERRMIGYFTATASLTIQNATLRQNLRHKVTAMASIAQFNNRLTAAKEMNGLLNIIFEEVTAMMKAEKASLMMLNESSGELMVKLVKGGKEEILKNYVVPVGQGLAGQVLRAGEPLLVKDLEHDARFGRRNRPNYRTPSFVIMPLKAGDRTIGVLNITDKFSGEVYTDDDLGLLHSLATQATVALERSEFYELSQELKIISITDSLTNLLNRRYFQERALEEIERSRRFNQPLSLIMIDVDDFKFYNDKHGHPAGDTVLKTTGTIIKAMVRNIDVVSRYGGEEFAILSPNTAKAMAMQIAERVNRGVNEHIFPHEKDQPGGDLTISVGVATFPEDAANLEDLINNADKALYLAKKAGKNRARLYSLSA